MNYNSTKSVTVEEAKKALERYCVYQERCHKEVEQKLRSLNLIPSAQEQIILHLLKNDFLNEERFSKAYARGKFRIKSWGKIRITLALKYKNITERNINTALAEIDDEDYFESFRVLSQRKFDSLKISDKYQKRKKLVDYLRYRGWENDLVFDRVKELIP